MKKKLLSLGIAAALLLGSFPASAAVDCGDAEGYAFGGSTYMSYPLPTYTQFPNGDTPWRFEFISHADGSITPMKKYLNGWSYNVAAGSEHIGNFTYGTISGAGTGFHPGGSADPILSFICPYDGEILLPEATVYASSGSADGTKIKLTLNDYYVYPSDGWLLLAPGVKHTFPETKLQVKAGDVLRWQVNKNGNQHTDGTTWSPITVSYVSDSSSAVGLGNGVTSPFPSDIVFNEPLTAATQYSSLKQNGAGNWYYQNCEVDTENYLDLSPINNNWFGGWYQNWNPGAILTGNSAHPGEGGDAVWTYACPKDGLIAIPQTVASCTSMNSRDGVRIRILNNSTPVYPASGWILLEPGSSVPIPELLFAVKAGDQIHFRVNCVANMDADGISWAPQLRYVTCPSYVPVNFTDIKGHWAKNTIEDMYELGIVSGRSNTIFAPDEPVTRAEFLTMAVRASQYSESDFLDTFSDVHFASWYARGVITAFENSLVDYSMVDGKNIYPEQGITREEAASVMVSAHQVKKRKLIDRADLSGFADQATITDWAREYMEKAVTLGFIQGNNNQLTPQTVLTRAEAAQLLSSLKTALMTEDPNGTLSKIYKDTDGNFLPVYQDIDLEELILDAYNSGASSVTIPKGVYRMDSKVNGLAIYLDGLQNFTINANDVVLSYKSATNNVMVLKNCSNVKLYGLTIDHEFSSAYQGIIQKFDENDMYFDAWMDPAYVPNMLNKRFVSPNSSTMSYFNSNEQMIPQSGGRALDGNIRKIGNNLYRFYVTRTADNRMVKEGDWVVGRVTCGNNLTITNCSDMYFEDFTIHNGFNGIFDSNAEKGATFENLRIVAGPKYETAIMPRMRSVNGTGYFVRGTRLGGVLNNSEISDTLDDGINVHASYDRLAKVEGNATYIIGASGSTAQFRVGDLLRFTSPDGIVRGEEKVVSCTKLSGQNFSFTDFGASAYYRVVLEKEIVGATFQDRSMNMNTLSSGLTITNCTFDGNSPRAILTHAIDSTIENCTFKDIRRWAILAAPELPTWNEGDYTQNLTITGCSFESNGRAGDTAMAAIGIWGDNANGSYSNKNITITNNTFTGQYMYDILLSFVDGATVTGNTFGPQAADAAEYGHPNYPSVFIFNDQNVVLSNNTFTSADRQQVKYGVDGTLKGF